MMLPTGTRTWGATVQTVPAWDGGGRARQLAQLHQTDKVGPDYIKQTDET